MSKRIRRQFSAEFKAQVVLEVLTGVKSAAEASREYSLKPEVLSRWKSEFQERAARVFARDEQHSQEQERIAELERLVGRLSLELEVAKKASSVLSSAWNGSGR
jgi:transposase-like protein